MTLKANLNDREYLKFFDDASISDHIVKGFDLSRIVPQRIDEISAVLSYYGMSLDPTAQDSDAKWLIWVVSKIGNITSVKLANNEEKFDKVWDDRYSYFAANPFNNPFSVNFLNANDYVNIGNVAALSFANASPFSMTFWSKSSVTTERVVFSKQGAGTASGYRFYTQSNQLGLLLSGGTGAADRIEIRSSNIGVSSGAWHNCAITYSGSGNATGVRFYHNGALDPTGGYTTVANALVGTIVNTTAAQMSGRNGTTNNFQGNLNNVCVWNKALSLAEVTEVYNLGLPGDLATHSAAANIAWWNVCYDEADVSLFPLFSDRSANNNDGTGVNMSLSQINIDVP